MDTGAVYNGTFTYPHGKGKSTVFRGTAIRLATSGEESSETT